MALILPYMGVWPRIAEDAFIAPTATVVGDVTIASGASVWFGAVIRADSAPVRIGARSNVQDNCVIHVDEGMPCVIEDECTLGHGAVVHGATIQAGALVGMHASVLNGAVVGAGCIVAAHALVPEGKAIPAGQLVMGVPGRVARRDGRRAAACGGGRRPLSALRRGVSRRARSDYMTHERWGLQAVGRPCSGHSWTRAPRFIRNPVRPFETTDLTP